MSFETWEYYDHNGMIISFYNKAYSGHVINIYLLILLLCVALGGGNDIVLGGWFKICFIFTFWKYRLISLFYVDLVHSRKKLDIVTNETFLYDFLNDGKYTPCNFI